MGEVVVDADGDARDAHLSAQVAAGPEEKAPELLAQEPTIERVSGAPRLGTGIRMLGR